jgi:hypothetical protein
MSEHTPGPWELQEGTQCCFHAGNRYAVTHSGGDEDEPWSVTIAEVWPTSDDSDKADARLIAAAPDLLAALEECVQELEKLGWGCAGYTDNAHAAIAKAKGAPDG